MKMRRKITLSEAEINLTPLIDVCFVILIMFIVVAPLLDSQRVELASAASTAVEPAKKGNALSIYVLKDNSIKVEQQSVTPEHLKETLAAAKRSGASSRAQLFHDKDATFGTYQSVKNALESAGFTEMDVILKKE